jgi:RNA polymerase sigma factor (sigma-70 family)
MAIGSSAVLRDIQTLFHLGTTGADSDAELLEQFLARRGAEAENAFAAVVARHGPMVLRVCRRVLSEPSDAEDAFQVTFLVLARKAKVIARRESLANWLYGVAVRTARELRASAARRRKREGQMKEGLCAHVAVDVANEEMISALDEELARLPAPFRAAVVLCDLEDKTHREAARILGVPVGTVSSRLVRGRSLLRKRLTRRGFNPSAGDSQRDRTTVSLPPPLIAATARAAARFAASGNLAGIVPAYLATLTQGVLKTMLLAKLTSKGMVIISIACLSLGAIAVTAGEAARGSRRANPETSGISGATDDAWAWVDDLRNADVATKERLKRCASSARSNFAAIHRLIFDYDLKNETPHLPLDASLKVKSVERGFSHGTVYWKDGIVRYDHHPVGKLAPDGRKLFYKRPWVQSVVRSRDMFAYTQQDSTWGLLLTVTDPPSVAEWEGGGLSQLRYLDPLLHYSQPFCQGSARLRQLAESCRTIESEEAEGKVLLRFLRADNDFRVEITCDKAVDWLPTRSRSGQVRDGKWVVTLELERKWQRFSAVWYPVYQVTKSYFGVPARLAEEIDLTIRNVRVNAAVNLPDSVFTLDAMDIPDGTPGIDRRHEPPQWLIRSRGVVRQPGPGEGRSPINAEQKQMAEETVPESESGHPASHSAAPSSRP